MGNEDRQTQKAIEKLALAAEKFEGVADKFATVIERISGTRPKASVAAPPPPGAAKSAADKQSESEADESRSKRRGQWVGGVAVGAQFGLGAMRAIIDPMQTMQEKAVQLAALAAQATGTGVATFAEKPLGTAAATRMGAAAEEAVNTAVQLGMQEQLAIVGSAKQGAGDLEQLAAVGVEISPETIQRRAEIKVEQAKRARDFQKKFTEAVGTAAWSGGGNPDDAVKAEAERAREDYLREFKNTLKAMTDAQKEATDDVSRANKSQS